MLDEASSTCDTPMVASGRLFSDQLRHALDASGMTRYRIAKLTGVDQSVLSRFMAGRAGLSLEAVDKLAAVLEIEIVTSTSKRKAKGR